MSDRHNGQRRCMRCSSSAHRLQKRECPHGTSASGALGSSRHTSQTARSAVVTGGATTSDGADEDDDDVEVVAASASSTSYVSVSSSSLLFTSASCSVGRLSAMWLTADKNSYRLYTPAANLSMQVLMRLSSLPVVSGGHVPTCYTLLQCPGSFHSKMLQEYKKLGWESLTRRRNAA